MDNETLSKLERLAKLKQDGAINDYEYQQQKASLLQINNKPRIPDKTTIPAPLWSKWLLGGIIALFFVGVFYQCGEDQKLEQNTSTVDEIVKSRNSDVESSFIKAETAIKHTLNDPDSYEEVSHTGTYVGKNGVYVSCLVTYRAKNAFGAYIVNKAIVNFNDKMEAIEVTPL